MYQQFCNFQQIYSTHSAKHQNRAYNSYMKLIADSYQIVTAGAHAQCW